MTTPEAFAAIALAAVACDGKLGRDEAHALRCQLEYRSLYKDCTDAAMGELFDRLLLLLRDKGVQGLIDSALPQLNGRQQQSALAVAAHLVHADRRITPEETDLLNQLSRQMSLPENEACMVIEAIEALNRDMLDS